VNCRNCRRQPVERMCEFGISRCRRKRVMTALSFCVRSIDRITSERGALYLYTWRWDRTGRRRYFRMFDHSIVSVRPPGLAMRKRREETTRECVSAHVTAASLARLKSYAVWYHHTRRARLHSRYCMISFRTKHTIQSAQYVDRGSTTRFLSTFYSRLFLIFQFACTDPIPCFSAPLNNNLFSFKTHGLLDPLHELGLSFESGAFVRDLVVLVPRAEGG
jgi:hypothetical protein